MNRFARIFEDETIGQILVTKDTCEDTYNAQLIFAVMVGGARISADITFKEDCFKERNEVFDAMSHEQAMDMATRLLP